MLPGDLVTIGTAVDTARMYVLDEDKHHSAEGTRGEIYIAGVQVLQAYVNSPTQTAGRVLPDPWHVGERMYRTGDYGMQGRDGRVVYIGRMDRQVKIRGSRVELSGVEQAILSGPADEGIAQCAVIAIHGTLVAFVTLDDNHEGSNEQRISHLRDRLTETLLPAWVPQIILPLAEFPRSVNGKADTRALESAYASKVASHQLSAAPVTSQNSRNCHIRDELAAEWCRILQLEPETRLQDSDDFVSLGGHSVLLMLLAARLSSTLGVDIPVRQLLPTPLFQGQVDLIRQLLGQPKPDEDNSRQEEGWPRTLSAEDLTELEKQVWLQCQVATNPAAFNIAVVLELSDTVDLGNLADSLDAALAFDPVLRSSFFEGPGGPRRRLRESAPKVSQVTELDLDAEASRPFDLENDELIRVYLVAATSLQPRLAIVTSHVIADMGTLQSLLQLTSTAYAGIPTASNTAKDQRPIHLDSDRWTKRPCPEAQAFWKEYLRGHGYDAHRPPLLPLSVPSLGTFQGTSRTYQFGGELVVSLNALVRRLGITHHQLALATAALTVQWLSHKTGNGKDHINDIVLGAPSGGRSSPAERQALGQFLDRLPVRVRLHEHDEADTSGGGISNNVTTTTLLARVRESARAALANAIPFSDILSVLGYPHGTLRHPLFDCMVTFHTRGAGLEKWLELPGGATAAPVFVRDVAKFPLMLEWFELDADHGDRWLLHVEMQDCEHNDGDAAIVDSVRDALEMVLRAVADECSLVELRARLDTLPLPAFKLPATVNGGCDGYGVDVSLLGSGSHSSSVVELAARIREEMVACLGDTSLDNNIQTQGMHISLDTSFFDAGADSAATILLRHRLRERLEVEVSARDIFAARSPLNLAQHIGR
jgi:acyl carrier protein